MIGIFSDIFGKDKRSLYTKTTLKCLYFARCMLEILLERNEKVSLIYISIINIIKNTYSSVFFLKKDLQVCGNPPMNGLLNVIASNIKSPVPLLRELSVQCLGLSCLLDKVSNS
jgi:hypothetical protein